MNNNVNKQTAKMVQLAILIAVMLIFAFTPLGYLKLGVIEITLMVIPVAVGAIVLGPAAGAILGGVFGITSFIQCFGASAFGVFLLGVNPILTFITCMIPRILCGLIPGLLFKSMHKKESTKAISFYVASLLTALLNTIFFMGCIVVFFWGNTDFIATMGSWGLPTDAVWPFLVAFVGVNGVVEALVNFIVGVAISKALVKVVKANAMA